MAGEAHVATVVGSDAGGTPPAAPAAERVVAVLSAGVHDPSNTAALAAELTAATVRAAESLDIAVIVRSVEVRDLAVDLALAVVGGALSPSLRAAVAAVTGADALIVVTPVFAASYAGLIKSFFDILDPDSLDAMPTIIAATGGSARHSLVIDHALRPLLAYFRAAVVPTGVFAAPADSDDALRASRIRERAARAGHELAGTLATRARRSERAQR